MPSRYSAYTLIEVLVGLTIVSLIFGFGYVSFRDFSRRQALAGSAKGMQGDIRLAQQLALSGQKPSDINCNGTNFLNGYDFNVVSTTEYRIVADCSGGVVSTIAKDVILPNGITLTLPTPNPIIFKVLGAGTNIPAGGTAAITLTQVGTNNKSTISVSSGGEVQ